MTDEELRALPHVNCPIAAEYLGMDQNKLRGGIVDGKIPVGYGTRGEDCLAKSRAYYRAKKQQKEENK